jgi:hypothetical protein
MMPRGLILALERFFENNSGWEPYDIDGSPVSSKDMMMAAAEEMRHPRRSEFMSRIAGVFLFHHDRSDIIAMSARGEIPELPDFQEKDFFADRGEWFWKHMDGRLPYGGWSEPTPPDKLAINCAVHGSAFVVNRAWFENVGGCSDIDCWQQDSVISARINNFSPAFIVRIPWLPSIPHFGGAASIAPDPTHRWTASVEKLACEHGYAYGGMPSLFYENGEPVAKIAILELGWRARAMALNKRYESFINGLDYVYRSECEPL